MNHKFQNKDKSIKIKLIKLIKLAKIIKKKTKEFKLLLY